MDYNNKFIGIETDRALSDILSNFSEDFITNMINEALQYRFRPYNTRIPNHPFVLEEKFKGIYDNYMGSEKEQIDETRHNTYMNIIEILCQYYNFAITSEIPDEQLYTLTYMMYQIFVSEFTDRMISMFTNYIYENIDSIVNHMTEPQKAIKTNYARKLYGDAKNPNYNIIYDNMMSVFDILIGIDIPFNDLLLRLSDANTAMFISQYIQDGGRLYKDHYAFYLANPLYRIDMLTDIRLRIVSITAQNSKILYPDSNPYIIDDNQKRERE